MEKFCVDSFVNNAQKVRFGYPHKILILRWVSFNLYTYLSFFQGRDIMEDVIRRVKEEALPLGIATQGLYKGAMEKVGGHIASFDS